MAASNVVIANITYPRPPDSGARAFHTIHASPETGEKHKNTVLVGHDGVKIENVRGKEDLYTLNNASFQFCTRPTNFSNFQDNKRVEEEYYPECVELIKELTQASCVLIFAHTRRLHVPNIIDAYPDRRQPVIQVHVDQTNAEAIACVHRHMPAEEAAELVRRRFQIINLWRPIGNPAIEFPLALCDYRSVDKDHDPFLITLIFPDREVEMMGIRYNPKHEWKYRHGMTPDEFVLIKCFDSLQDGGVALFAPHTALEDPTTPDGVPHRESIELRTLVFYD